MPFPKPSSIPLIPNNLSHDVERETFRAVRLRAASMGNEACPLRTWISKTAKLTNYVALCVIIRLVNTRKVEFHFSSDAQDTLRALVPSSRSELESQEAQRE